MRNRRDIDPRTQWLLRAWLAQYPAPRELYEAKEALSSFYCIRGLRQAAHALTALIDRLALSDIPEIKTFRSTLIRWRHEILAESQTRATNGMTEGFNCKAKLVKRRALGYSASPTIGCDS